MIDRSELLQVELFPFSDGTLFRYFSHQGRATWTVRYLHMVMIQRYYDMLSQKYDWNVEIPTYNESLTSQTIARDLLEENFIDIQETNYRLLEVVTERFGWKTAAISVDTDYDVDYVELSKEEERLNSFLDNYPALTSEDREMFLLCKEAFRDVDRMINDALIWVMEHSKLGRYLKFREQHEDQVHALFGAENARIDEILEFIDLPLDLQPSKIQKRSEGRFLVAFVCGDDSYYDFDLEYLTPEWVIGSFVMYELLLHAEEIFQY